MFKQSFLKKVAQHEKVSVAFLSRQLARGRVVIPINARRNLVRPVAIGQGLKVKINTNVGTSTVKRNVAAEVKKIKVAQEYGTDTVMDLSVGGNLGKVRQRLLQASDVPLGTVPIYEVVHEVERRKSTLEEMTFDDIWDVLTSQAEAGVDFFTIHAGILKSALTTIKKKKRVGGIVSRGGAMLARWMYIRGQENPLYVHYDKILQLAKKHNVTLSLGDALRPGAIADSTDALQLAELRVLGELVKRSHRAGVQVMVEGPGHIRLDEIAHNMRLQQKICDHAPFYILGPLPTDLAAGHDHITSSIGGAIAAMNGANFLCVVTPAEHLRHPSLEDIKNGVIASKIAAHSVDVLNFKDEWNKDKALSEHRARRNWEALFPLTLDVKKARKYRSGSLVPKDICSMCGTFCSLKLSEACDFLQKI